MTLLVILSHGVTIEVTEYYVHVHVVGRKFTNLKIKEMTV